MPKDCISFSERVISLFFPRTCVLCEKPIAVNDYVCDKCHSELIPTKGGCRGCGQKKCTCGLKDRLYDKCISAYIYKGSLKEAFKKFKFRGQRYRYKYYAGEMSKVFFEECKTEDYDFVTVIPGSHSKKENGGYNPSLLLAKQFARNIGLPLIHSLKNVKNIKIQHDLPLRERILNVRGAYKAVGNYKGKRILLVDDIRTSGFTLSECAKELKFAGADYVTAVTLFAPKPYKRDNTNTLEKIKHN